MQGALKLLFLLRGQPVRFRRLVIDHLPPEERPNNRRQTFKDEHPSPADRRDEIPGDDRHPQYGHGIAKDEEGVGA
ncbi:hypothetical protein D3C87_1718160 [compost metagenome]